MGISIKNFSAAEAFNSPNGKTSMPLICAFLLVLTGCVGYLYGIFKSSPEAHVSALGFATLGSGLLGIRRFTPDKEIKEANKE